MTQEKDSKAKFSVLRSQAEELLGPVSVDQKDISALSPEEVQVLVHDLRIHQIELKLQNDDLRQSQIKLEELKDRYLDLYDFAPVGYMTLNDKGLILEANLTAIRLLGVERTSLIKMFFSRFVCQEFMNAYYLYLKQVFESQSEQTCEIKLTRKDGTGFYAQLESIPVQYESGQFNRCRTVLSDITKRKRVEEALRESEERHRGLVEHLPQCIFIKDRNSVYLSCNANYAAQLGITPEQIVGKDDFAFHPPELARAYRTDDETCMATGMVKDVEEPYQLTGQEKWAHTIKVPYCDEKGRVIGVLGIFEDITEHKRSDETLRTKTHQLNKRVKELNGLFAISKLVEKSDISLDQLFQGVVDIIPPSWQYPEITCANMILQDREFKTENYKVPVSKQSSDIIVHGERIGLLEVGYLEEAPESDDGPFLKEERNLINTITERLCRIIERKRGEEALRISEEKFSKAFFLSPDAISINRLVDGVYVSVNEGFKQILGFAEEELIGKTAPEINIWDNPEDRNRLIEALKDEGKANNFEFRFRTKDGDIRYGLMSAAIIELNGVDHILSVTRDISERVQAEEERESLRSQLLQSQKMEAVGTLAGGIAHDFNNLLQVVLGYSQLLLAKKSPNSPEYDNLKKITVAARHAADLVKGLLAFSRRATTQPRPLDLNYQVTEVGSLLERTIPKMIKIDLRLEEDLSVIHADPGQIEQILMNLGVNSRDAMPDGGVLIIETRNALLDQDYCRNHIGAKPGRHVMLVVSDTGQGIDKETLEHIFEPFYTTKDVGKGTGLGLSMVYGIVKQHGGHISCESRPGHGTTFRIYFPAVEEEEEEHEQVDVFSPPGGLETLLIVDDEELVRDLGSDYLRQAGYTVLTASNGREALEVYQEKQADVCLVLLDLIMPEMGGRKCFKELLKINPKVKVLIVSGYTSGGTEKDAVELGARGFVEKPYDLTKLLQIIRQVLDEG